MTLRKWGHLDRVNPTYKMLLAFWTFYTILNGFRSFNAKNLGSVGQRAAKLPAIKLWEWLDRDRGFEPEQTGWLGPGPAGRLFLRPPTLTAGNFAALWPTDPKFLALKDLNPFKTVSKVQKTSSILRVGFALSKWPHLHRAYVVTVCNQIWIAVYNIVVAVGKASLWGLKVEGAKKIFGP